MICFGEMSNPLFLCTDSLPPHVFPLGRWRFSESASVRSRPEELLAGSDGNALACEGTLACPRIPLRRSVFGPGSVPRRLGALLFCFFFSDRTLM